MSRIGIAFDVKKTYNICCQTYYRIWCHEYEMKSIWYQEDVQVYHLMSRIYTAFDVKNMYIIWCQENV